MTRATIVGLWLASAGCTPEATGDSSLLLAAGAIGQVDLRRLGAVRLDPRGPVVATGDGDDPYRSAPVTFDVVDAWTDQVAVRELVGNLELILWVARDDAVPWTLEAVGGGALGGPDAVSLDAGVPLEILDRADGQVLVHIDQPPADLEVWVDARAVGEVRTVPPADEAPALDGPTRCLQVPEDLLDAPQGGWLGQLHGERPRYSAWSGPVCGDDAIGVRQRGPEVDGFAPIAWAGKGVRVDAWVPAERLGEHFGAWGAAGYGRRISCGGFFAPRATILAGARLYREPEGDVVGEALDDASVSPRVVDAPTSDGWHRVRLRTSWGGVDTWVAPGDLELPPPPSFALDG